jgi:hypothetical protein
VYPDNKQKSPETPTIESYLPDLDNLGRIRHLFGNKILIGFLVVLLIVMLVTVVLQNIIGMVSIACLGIIAVVFFLSA